jgi:hypothetical protein
MASAGGRRGAAERIAWSFNLVGDGGFMDAWARTAV